MPRAFLLLPFALAACITPRTEVVVVVDSDLGDALDSISVLVTGPDDNVERDQDIAIGAPPRYPLPLSFGVAPRDDDPNREVRIDLAALDQDRNELSTARAYTMFRRHEKLRLDIVLYAACAGIDCAEDQTCGEAATCVSAKADRFALPPWPDD